jgi:hypothetical protein
MISQMMSGMPASLTFKTQPGGDGGVNRGGGTEGGNGDGGGDMSAKV